jgi:hypothetical protein
VILEVALRVAEVEARRLDGSELALHPDVVDAGFFESIADDSIAKP